MTKSGDPWQHLLDPDEVIIWQGAPEPGVRLEWDSPLMPFFFLFFTGFSVFWMVMASLAPGPFWMFGLIFFGIGMYNLVGIHFWRAVKRKGTFYSLSTRRALIATNAAGKKALKSYPITADTPLELAEGRFDDVWFAQVEQRTQSGNVTRNIGFERLKNGREIYAKLREIQRGLPVPVQL